MASVPKTNGGRKLKSDSSSITKSSTPASSFESMKSTSMLSDNPFFTLDSEFDLMHVRITVFSLTGILVEKKEDGKGRWDAKDAGATVSMTSDENFSPLGQTPVHAVVTLKRNVSSSSTTIASHLPSNPLENALSAFGTTFRYNAVWPVHKASFLTDKNEPCTPNDQSSIIVERVMMRESVDSVSNFVAETINLEINLKRGDEMIPLGSSTLVISGDEEGPIAMNLAAKGVRMKGKHIVTADIVSKTSKKNRFFSKSAVKPSFSSDKSLQYTLDENAALKVKIQVIPYSLLRETEAAKVRRAEVAKRKMAQHQYRQRILLKKAQEEIQNEHRQQEIRTLSEMGNVVDPSTPLNSQIERFFCSPNFMCSTSPKTVNSRMSKNPRSNSFSNEISQKDSSSGDGYLTGNSGVSSNSSVLSSVSESESESESDSGSEREEEYRKRFLNKSIIIHKRYDV
jgi:hypothetical protein